MAISPDRKPKLNFEQKVAVATSRYLQGKRGELVVSKVSKLPDGLEDGETAFEPDSLGGIRRILTQARGIWQEIYILGPVKNHDRELISRYFGLDERSNPRTVTDYLGNMSFQRKLLIATEQEGGVFK